MSLPRRLASQARLLATALALTALVVALGTIALGDDDDARTASAPADRAVTFEPIAARSANPDEVIPLESALPPQPGAAAPPPVESAPDDVAEPEPEPPAARAPDVAEPAFEVLPIVDPRTQAAVQPVAFTALPAAEAPAPAPGADDDVPVYVPGSIAKAKRQWAGGNGAADPVERRGGFVIIGSGGHCPVPGRVIPPYKGRSGAGAEAQAGTD